MRTVRGVLRVLRGVAIGVLTALPVALAVLAYVNRDYLNRDGLLLLLSNLLREDAPAAAPPAEDWGHDALPPPDPDVLAIAPLLRAGDHAGLDALAERDAAAFDRFRDTSPDLAEALDGWVAARPGAPLPRLVRGRYWHNVGWHQRGHAYFSQTTEGQIARMRAAFARARADLEAAIGMDPSAPQGYPLLLRIHSARGGEAEAKKVWDRAIAAGAASTRLHSAYFDSLTPWWSGLSAEESAATIRGLVREIASGRLAGTGDAELLGAFPDYVEAEVLYRTGRREAAYERYDGFAEGAAGRLYRDRYAGRLLSGGRLGEAVVQFAAAVRDDPASARSWRDYGDALRRLGLHAEAEEALGHALALDPYDPRARLVRAQLRVTLRRFEAALGDIDRAEVYGAERESVLRGAGRIRVRLADDLAAAVADYRAAIEADPERVANHYFLGALLDRMRDCGAIPAYRHYVEMCREGAACIPGTVNRSAVRWQSLVDRYICSIDGHRLEPEPAWVAVPAE